MIATERLLLRMLRAEDFDAYAEIQADEEVTRYTSGKPMTRAEAWRHLAMVLGHWQLRGFGFWAIEERATGKMVGRVGFHQPEEWPDFEIGWTVARPHWGRGYATEAARAALDYGFRELGRNHIISLIHPENDRSIRVAERLGEKLEGEAEIGDHMVKIYGIDRVMWERASARSGTG